jgi:cob(I)alamin adenosyltransferase
MSKHTASSPDLLAALKELLRWIPAYPASADGIIGGREAHAAAIAAARAVIAKAEGSA